MPLLLHQCTAVLMVIKRNKTEPFEELTTPNTNVNTRLYNFPTFISDYPESVRVSTPPM